MDGNGTESWPTAIGKTGTVCFLRLRIGWMISFQTGTLEFGPRRKGGNTSPAAGPSSTRFRWYAIPITIVYGRVQYNSAWNQIESNRIESKLMGVVFHRKKRRFGERSIRSRTLLLLCSSTLPPSRLGGFSRPKDRCWMVVLCSRWIGCGSVPLVYQSLRCSSAHTQHHNITHIETHGRAVAVCPRTRTTMECHQHQPTIYASIKNARNSPHKLQRHRSQRHRSQRPTEFLLKYNTYRCGSGHIHHGIGRLLLFIVVVLLRGGQGRCLEIGIEDDEHTERLDTTVGQA